MFVRQKPRFGEQKSIFDQNRSCDRPKSLTTSFWHIQSHDSVWPFQTDWIESTMPLFKFQARFKTLMSYNFWRLSDFCLIISYDNIAKFFTRTFLMICFYQIYDNLVMCYGLGKETISALLAFGEGHHGSRVNSFHKELVTLGCGILLWCWYEQAVEQAI